MHGPAGRGDIRVRTCASAAPDLAGPPVQAAARNVHRRYTKSFYRRGIGPRSGDALASTIGLTQKVYSPWRLGAPSKGTEGTDERVRRHSRPCSADPRGPSHGGHPRQVRGGASFEADYSAA